MFKDFLFGGLPESNSPAGELNAIDLKKTGRMLVIVLAGGLATAFFDFASNFLLHSDFGKYQILISMIVSSGILEIARRYVADFISKEREEI
jgi:hypothetical protein